MRRASDREEDRDEATRTTHGSQVRRARRGGARACRSRQARAPAWRTHRPRGTTAAPPSAATAALRARMLAFQRQHGYLPLKGFDTLRRAKAHAAAMVAARGATAGRAAGRPVAPAKGGPKAGASWLGPKGPTPPDANGAVGPKSYIEITNGPVSIFERDGTLIATANLNTLTGNPSGGDPMILWDPDTQRFYFSAIGTRRARSTGASRRRTTRARSPATGAPTTRRTASRRARSPTTRSSARRRASSWSGSTSTRRAARSRRKATCCGRRSRRVSKPITKCPQRRLVHLGPLPRPSEPGRLAGVHAGARHPDRSLAVGLRDGDVGHRMPADVRDGNAAHRATRSSRRRAIRRRRRSPSRRR